MPTLAGMVSSGSGRFVPPITVARTGLGLTAGQFKITTANYAQYDYTLTGTYTTRAADIVSLTNTNTTGTVTPVAPKGLISGTTVNVARTPYTYHNAYNDHPQCATNWHSGQCAAWGPPAHSFAYSAKNPTPTNYTDSEGEWWRIW